MNDLIELRRLFNIVLRRWWLLVAMIAIAVGGGYTISKRQTPVYQAKVTVLVGEITQSSNLNREDVQMSTLFAQTYADLAVRQPVLRGVVQILGLNETWEDLRDQVHVSAIDGTQLIEIKAEANTPELARSIADEVAKNLILLGPTAASDLQNNFARSFVQQQMEDTQSRILNGQQRIKDIEDAMSSTISTDKLVELQTEKTNLERLITDLVMNYVQLSNMASQDRNPNSLSIIEAAYAEDSPIRPRVSLNIFLSAGLGAFLALGLIFLWEFLDDVVKSPDDLEQFRKMNLLGKVGRIKGRTDSDKLISHLEPFSPVRESFRMIRNKIRLGPDDQAINSIVVTSPETGEGKSITAANLAVIMAQANIKTILVDADLRHPVLHEMFHVVNKSGLANLLDAPKMNILYCLNDTFIKNLQIVTSGDSSQDRSDQLLSERISELLNFMKGRADLVIIDSPPTLMVAEAMILSNRADGVIVVVRGGKTRRKAIRQMLIDLEEANANLLGYIYNQAHKGTGIARYNGYRQEKRGIQNFAIRILERFRIYKGDNRLRRV